MKILIRLFITSLLVIVIANFLPGVTLDTFVSSIYVAIVLGLLNIFVKPILVFFTFPITILTLGLFLLIINALIIILCDAIVGGFAIHSFITAIVFSLILSISQSILYRVTDVK